MNKKNIIILILVLIVFLIFGLKEKNKNTILENKNTTVENNDNQTFLLEKFPIEKVPLYKLEKVSSNKIFVNTDPKNISTFGDKNFAYYNVVFYSTASQEEFLNYYKNLFETQIKEEFESPDMVKGTIGDYKVSAAHYNSGNTGYLQVHLPDYNDESIQDYFAEYPKFFEINDYLVEHEKSYGLLNQKGGEIEYTKYFTVIDSGDQNNDGKDDLDEFLVLRDKFKEQYKNESEYQFDEKTSTMKWKNQNFEITLVISKDHGRVYLMIRKN